MKKKFKKNQIMITALALMIAIAGYMQFSGNYLSDEELAKSMETEEMVKLDDMEEYTDHGCGCTLSSGITAMIAAGNNFRNALTAAAAHVFGALTETAHIGKNLDAMYPPLDDYSSAITLRSLEKNSERKGSRHDR